MVYLSMLPVAQYRSRVENLSLSSAVVLLRNLGNFDLDDLAFSSGVSDTYYPVDILRLLGPALRVKAVKCPLAFKGGPSQACVYRASYTTFILDRMLLTMCERGLEFVERILAYSEGFNTEGTPCCR